MSLRWAKFQFLNKSDVDQILKIVVTLAPRRVDKVEKVGDPVAITIEYRTLRLPPKLVDDEEIASVRWPESRPKRWLPS